MQVAWAENVKRVQGYACTVSAIGMTEAAKPVRTDQPSSQNDVKMMLSGVCMSGCMNMRIME